LRYFNVYGPGQPSTGAYALVVGIFLNKYRNKETLEIHGSGEQRRDFIHVSDVVQANIKAMETQHVGEIFNVGSGINYSVNELAAFFPFEKFIRNPGRGTPIRLWQMWKRLQVCWDGNHKSPWRKELNR